MTLFYVPSKRFPGRIITVDLDRHPTQVTGRELSDIRDFMDEEAAAPVVSRDPDLGGASGEGNEPGTGAAA